MQYKKQKTKNVDYIKTAQNCIGQLIGNPACIQYFVVCHLALITASYLRCMNSTIVSKNSREIDYRIVLASFLKASNNWSAF